MKATKQLKMVYVHPNKLIPYENNAKTHPQEQIDKISESIDNYDFDVPIVVDANMVIIKGHGRQAAAFQAGLKKVPIIIRTDLTEVQVKAARLADNRLAETDWDIETLLEELSEIDNLSEINFTGFDDLEIEDLRKEITIGAESFDVVGAEIGLNDMTTTGVIKLVYSAQDYKAVRSAIANDERKPEEILKEALGL